ncbi:methyltransferase [Orbaceae bacterium ESL0721]|nr:methyltransferase [Orbaceae bacterium ESL0721]
MPHQIQQVIEEVKSSPPLKSGGFTFKRFFVAHSSSPMKITTDSVLLGAWAPIDNHPKRILDIGTGCGVIGLMLAQRLEQFNESQIDVLDIDADAIRECEMNIASSPFTNIQAIHDDIKKWRDGNHHQYDLIVCNPPYFNVATACRNEQRQKARYTKQLTHAELCIAVEKLLSKRGRFSLVLPFNLAEKFIELAAQSQLVIKQRVDVRYSEIKDFSLVLLTFIRSLSLNEGNKEIETGQSYRYETLCMRHSDNSYTEAFRTLLKAFYLRF